MANIVQWAETHHGAGVAGLLLFYDKPLITWQTERKKTKKEKKKKGLNQDPRMAYKHTMKDEKKARKWRLK